MWYISFHGGKQKENNIWVYNDNGDCVNKGLLPLYNTIVLKELRGFLFRNDQLFVVNAHKTLSEILLYESNGRGGYEPASNPKFADPQTTGGIFHPYDLTFDEKGTWYISSQDTNVVTWLSDKGQPQNVASYLQQHFPPEPPNQYYPGTFVASKKGKLPNTPSPYPPDVSSPQGLDVSCENHHKNVKHSVRGIAYYEGALYVSDEPGNKVKAFCTTTGELLGELESHSHLRAPVQLLIHKDTLYIASTKKDNILTHDLTLGAPQGQGQTQRFYPQPVEPHFGNGF